MSQEERKAWEEGINEHEQDFECMGGSARGELGVKGIRSKNRWYGFPPQSLITSMRISRGCYFGMEKEKEYQTMQYTTFSLTKRDDNVSLNLTQLSTSLWCNFKICSYFVFYLGFILFSTLHVLKCKSDRTYDRTYSLLIIMITDSDFLGWTSVKNYNSLYMHGFIWT